MSAALPGEHLCKAHQGNHAHYSPDNCTVCKLTQQLKSSKAREEALREYAQHHGHCTINIPMPMEMGRTYESKDFNEWRAKRDCNCGFATTTTEGGRMKRHVAAAAIARTTLYTFAAVVELMEGPTRPEGRRAMRAASRIIRICKREQMFALRAFDAALAKAAKGEA